MDGVLNVYDKTVYNTDNLEETPEFIDPTKHYYLNVPSDQRALELFNLCLNQDNFDVYILSSCHKRSSIFIAQRNDKLAWLSKHIPRFAQHHFITIPVGKSKAEFVANMLGRERLSNIDILIDDYSKNLNEWNALNGQGLKYYNSENTLDSYNGLTLDKQTSAQDVVDIINTIAQ
jgi:hypothetical protein